MVNMTADSPIPTGTAAIGLKNSVQGGFKAHAVQDPATITVLFLPGPSFTETPESFNDIPG